MEKNDIKITVVGSAWYGDWAKSFYAACRRLGIPSEIVYTNAFPASVGGNREALVSFFEKSKAVVRRAFPSLFPFLKRARKFASDLELCMKVVFSKKYAKHICVYIWIPGSAWVLRFLKRKNSILALWMGESTVRDASWEPLFDYFDSIFMVGNGIWLDALKERRNKERVGLLPLACEDHTFFPIAGQQKTIDVVFVGKYLPARADVLSYLKDFKIKIYGYGWEDGFLEHPWLKEVYAGVLSASGVNTVYNSAKIAIGTLWLSKEPYTGPTQRIFEIALTGTFQIAEDVQLSRQLFGDSIEYFNTAEELKEKARYYLKNQSEREAKAWRARKEGLKYTYTEAVKKILASCGVVVEA